MTATGPRKQTTARLLRAAGAAAFVTLAVSGAALAQVGAGGGDIKVNADAGDYFRKELYGVWTGNVVITQGKAMLKADKVTIYCVKPKAGAADPEANANGCDEVEKVVAENKVFYITAAERIKGDRGEYDYATDTITVTGDVIMLRANEGVMNGRKLIYNVTEGRARMAGEEGQKGGVTGIFQRKSGTKPAASPSPSPSPPTP